MLISDWSSDVCSSDLGAAIVDVDRAALGGGREIGGIEAVPDERRPKEARVHTGKTTGDHHILRIAVDEHLLEAGLGVGLARGQKGRADIGKVRRSEEHTSELQSLMRLSYAVFCL